MLKSLLCGQTKAIFLEVGLFIKFQNSLHVVILSVAKKYQPNHYLISY